MSQPTNQPTNPADGIDPLKGSTADFMRPTGRHLLDRIMPLHTWLDARRDSGHWQYQRALTTGPKPHASLIDCRQRRYDGVNFAVQDYLGLSTHPAIIDVACETAHRMGVHSAGSAGLVGNSDISWRLQEDIGRFLNCRYVKLFPTGWAAAFGVVYGLVKKNDYIVMDQLAHASLQTGAQAATENIVRFRHNSMDELRDALAKIRARSADAAILVIIESLYSMDSDVPDICRAQELAHEFDATLLVDAAHDLGNLGPDGKGLIAAQGMLGKVDIIMGSFSKTFASNGGFIATNHPAVDDYLTWFSSAWPFSNGLSPVQCAVVSKALEIVQRPEGQALRDSMMQASLGLRNMLARLGLEAIGQPSAIVPVVVGEPVVIRTASRLLQEYGVFANMVEFPVVPLPRARFRMQVMATHTQDDVQRGALAVQRAIEDARRLVGAGG